MTDNKYEKLDRIRTDIQADRDKLAKMREQAKIREGKMLDQIREKEAKLKEAESLVIVADVGEVNLSPEQLGAFLKLIQSGKISNSIIEDLMTEDDENLEETHNFDETEDEENNEEYDEV